MSVRGLAVAGLLVLLGSSSSAAQGGDRAPVRVTAQVVRACRVTTATAQVVVDCGRRPQLVEVRHDQSPPTRRALSAATGVAPASARAVTIDF